jgi:glycosyltransferase involved in cell wall biosynthesis
MKILQVIHGFPPYNIAGSELYTYNLARELAREDEVYVFHRIDDRNLKEYEIIYRAFDGLKVYVINNTLKCRYTFEQTYKNDMIGTKFGELLDEIRPYIVHFGHLLNLSTTLIRETKKRDIPSVFTLHDFWLACPRGQLLKRDLTICDGPEESVCTQCMAAKLAMKKSIRYTVEAVRKRLPNLENGTFLGNILEKFYQHYSKTFLLLKNKETKNQILKRMIHIKELYSLVDVFIAPCNFLLGKFLDFGIPRHKMIHCDHGFNTSLFDNSPKVPSKKVRFGYTGTFIPSKGLHVLLRAFNEIESPNTELRIHGKFVPYDAEFNDYPSFLRSLSKKDNVLWLGQYENKNIAEILAEIDVLVLPSIWYENSPLVIREAFMGGVPVIASNIGGMAELIQHGINGLSFEVGDYRDLAKKMQMILDDPGLIRRLSKNIEQVIPMESHAWEIKKIYKYLLNNKIK